MFWAICWHRIRMKGKSCNEKVTEIRDNNEIMRLKWMKNELECRSERMCIHMGFYVIQYIWSREVRWWASPPHIDLSPCTRVYIRGGCWVRSEWILPVWSGTVLQIPIKRSLDLFQLSYLGLRYDIVARQPSAWICPLSNSWKDSEDPGGACLSPLYTRNWLFSKSRLLAIVGLPWPMTLWQQ